MIKPNQTKGARDTHKGAKKYIQNFGGKSVEKRLLRSPTRDR